MSPTNRQQARHSRRGTEASHIRIEFPVGYKAKNAKRDVDKIHDIINKIPPMQGGAPGYIPPNTPYSPN